MLGRELLGPTDDDRLSREHVRVTRDGQRYVVEDLGSRNGTSVAGNPLTASIHVKHGALVRAGRTIAVLLDDITPFAYAATSFDGLVSGGRTADLHHEIAISARSGTRIVIRGEGGSGRGHLAHMYARWADHASTRVVENIARMNERAQEEFLEQLQSSTAPAVFTVNVHTSPLPGALADALAAAARWFELPPLRERPDELTLIVHELVKREAERAQLAELACHVSLIEHCLLTSRDIGLLAEQVTHTAQSQAQLGKPLVRSDDLQRAVRMRWAMHGQPNQGN